MSCTIGVGKRNREIMAKNQAATKRSVSGLNALLYCKCSEQYTIEKHGDGYAVYFGRCVHRHGYNLCQITVITREDIIKSFAAKLNLPEISFKSDASGLEYNNHNAAGDYSEIKIGGRVFRAI